MKLKVNLPESYLVLLGGEIINRLGSSQEEAEQVLALAKGRGGEATLVPIPAQVVKVQVPDFNLASIE